MIFSGDENKIPSYFITDDSFVCRASGVNTIEDNYIKLDTKTFTSSNYGYCIGHVHGYTPCKPKVDNINTYECMYSSYNNICDYVL